MIQELVELHRKGAIDLSVFNYQITLVMELLIAVEIQTAKQRHY
jgi:hypothetical protein